MSEEKEPDSMSFLEKQVDRHEEEIKQLHVRHQQHASEINTLKVTTSNHEQSIENLRQDLSIIKEDTRWLRRTITKAFITAIIGAAITFLFSF